MTQLHRIPVETVIANLKTASEKIRELAKAGYERADIARLLGIRYQRVRKVLVDAGFTGGLQRAPHSHDSPKGPASELATPGPTRSAVLLQAGFRAIGEWIRSGESGIKLNGDPPRQPGVYAFAVDGIIAYVGSTTSGLRTRMDQYRLGHKDQRTNERVNRLIDSAIAAGQKVEILVATPDHKDGNGLPVNMAVGLEAGLIEMIRPEWNKQNSR